MPPGQKKFVKYTFEDPKNNKPKESKEREPRQSRENFKEKDTNTTNRTKRHVSYTQKSSLKQNVLSQMINSFIPLKKPTKQIQQLMKNFPKYFNEISKEPEPFSNQSLNPFLIIIGKKPTDKQFRSFAPIQHQSEQDPDWDSESDHEGGIQSRKIDQQLIEKTKQKISSIRQLRSDELKRHEKQFLEDYYRQKHQQEVQREEQEAKQVKNTATVAASNKPQETNKQFDFAQSSITKDLMNSNDGWTDYQEKQVNEFVNMGFIQKLEGNEDENEEEFGEEDFSFEEEKRQKSQSKSSKSSDGEDDDIFGDVEPTIIVKKKEIKEEDNSQSKNSKDFSQGTVLINSQIFSKIAQQAGIPPAACIWIIRNKNQRYKVTTHFMDQMYRLNNFCESLPFISLNHSQFVHNNDVQKERGIQIFKKYNARRQQFPHQNNHQQINNQNRNRNQEANKRKIQYKPNPQKAHLNKK